MDILSLSWNCCDTIIDDDPDKSECAIFISGVSTNLKSYTVKVIGFQPYFYVEIPNNFNTFAIKRLFGVLKKYLKDDEYSLVRYELKKNKKLYPFTYSKINTIKLYFSTTEGFKRAAGILKRPLKVDGFPKPILFSVYDTMVNHINRFCHVTGIEPCSWLTIEDAVECGAVYVVSCKGVKQNNDNKITPGISIFSWDLECLPENTEKFPDSTKENDIISQIGITIHKYGTTDTKHYIFTASECKDIDGVKVYSSTSEKDMLKKFVKFFVKADPDILVGYNSWGFDDKYLWNRLALHGINTDFLSRVPDIPAKLVVKKMSSGARGSNEFVYIECPGRETFDLMVAIKRDHIADLYSLNFVSGLFLNEKKVDMKYSDLFRKLVGNPDEVAECAVYCVQDSNLPVRLMNKLNMLSDSMEMAKATCVPMNWLLIRGQQCKVFSLISKQARIFGSVIPVLQAKDNDKFQGATVLEPKIGQHYVPIAGLDFASLYPSIMIAYNLCYSTIIESEEVLEYVRSNGIPYKEIIISDTKKCYFVQCKDEKGNPLENGVEGIVPGILLKLWSGRKETKKLMNSEKDPFIKAMLNGKQLAQKVTMNSVYGFTGASKGILPLKEIAESVTATGRQVILKTSKIAGDVFGGITVYGDSIPGYELITINGKDISIEEFGNTVEGSWQEYRGFKIGDHSVMSKEFKNTEGYVTLTHNGYQKVNKIIRHDTSKKLYRIKAVDSNGIIHEVVVTEGHSLIKPDLTTVEADKLKIGDELFKL